MSKRSMTMSMLILVAILILPGIGFSQHTDKSNPPVGDSKKSKDSTNKQDSTATRQGQDSKTDMASGSGNESLSSSDRRFVMGAAHSGMMEIDLGRLGVERATSDEVKQFAQRMIDDHTRANTELMTLASGKGMSLPMDASAQGTPESSTKGSGINPHSGERTDATDTTQKVSTSSGSVSSSKSRDDAKMMQKHQALKNKLSRLSGAEFDREYMRQMVKDHSDAVSMFERQSSRGNDAELKSWAAKTLPALREHLQMARDISAKTGGK